MKQITKDSIRLRITRGEFTQKGCVKCHKNFLDEIELLPPWAQLHSLSEQACWSGTRVGHRLIEELSILRMRLLHRCSGLTGEAVKDAVDDSHATREFLGINTARESSAPETAVLP